MNTNDDISMQILTTGEVNSVDARELHKKLGVGRDFSNWIKDRIEKYGFTEGEDFSPILANGNQGGRASKEYFVTFDMAKEIAMVENSEQGRRVRRYFIECEKRLRKQSERRLRVPENFEEALRLAADQHREIMQLNDKIADDKPKVDYYNEVFEEESTYSMSAAVKLAGLPFGSTTMFQMLRRDGLLMSKGGPDTYNIPYQDRINQGLFTVIMRPYLHPVTGEMLHSATTRVTSKGVEYLFNHYKPNTPDSVHPSLQGS